MTKAKDEKCFPTPEAGVRLNKAIAAAGFCSRRKADDLILRGQVQIDGITETNPARRVFPNEKISIDGKQMHKPQTLCYYLLHKPVHTVCTAFDPQGRPTVLDCLPDAARQFRLYPVGRLDYFSEGLLLLTNDGELAQRLTHPRYHLPKTYEVLLRESPSARALAVMRQGMTLAEGEKLLPVTVDIIQEMAQGKCLLRMVLRQGVNRQIRRMCRDLKLTILRLRRVAQGPLVLGSLQRGQVRELSLQELSVLRKCAGLHNEGDVKEGCIPVSHDAKCHKAKAGPSPVTEAARHAVRDRTLARHSKALGKKEYPDNR